MLSAGRQLYPAAMRMAGKDGWIKVEFIVQTDGRVDPCTIRVLEYSDEAFIDPGVDMLLNSAFSRPEYPTYMQQTINWRVSG